MSANLMSLARSGGKFLKLFGDRKMMKTMPTASDMVLDGMLLGFDAIENGGFGITNPDSTTCTSLVGNYTFNFGVKPSKIAYELNKQNNYCPFPDTAVYYEIVFYSLQTEESFSIAPLYYCNSSFDGFGCKLKNASEYNHVLMYACGKMSKTEALRSVRLVRSYDNLVLPAGGTTGAGNLRFATNFSSNKPNVAICGCYFYDHILTDDEFAKNKEVYAGRFGKFGSTVSI